jgi:hypothetical protein
MNELYISELLSHNIKLCRENDQFESYKADIADALCGVTIAMDEVTNPRTKKLLEIARDVITTHHFYVDLMAEVECDK